MDMCSAFRRSKSWDFYEKQKEFFEVLEAYRSKQASYFAALLVTDVNTQNSLLLISAPPEFLATITYPNQTANLFELNNVVSQKKTAWTIPVRSSSQNQCEYFLTRDQTCRKKLVLGFARKPDEAGQN
jgi:inorganic pyrophosphatase/exopolyphosphatase